jgi:uncharacterized membrane protein YdjX (TVP38/TMEM64 family)
VPLAQFIEFGDKFLPVFFFILDYHRLFLRIIPGTALVSAGICLIETACRNYYL